MRSSVKCILAIWYLAITDLNDNVPRIVSEQTTKIIDDKYEEERRESNIIIFGVPDSEEGDTKAKDIDFIHHICRESLCVEIIIDEITRLGVKHK